MREILFRGKTLTDKWVEGAYYKQEKFYGDKEDAHIIITSKETLENDFALESHMVIPETVGQYTGLTDKNGTKIFEGDIVNIHYHETTAENIVIKYIGASFYGDRFDDTWELDNYYQLEIIGNIHDNSEMLGEK